MSKGEEDLAVFPPCRPLANQTDLLASSTLRSFRLNANLAFTVPSDHVTKSSPSVYFLLNVEMYFLENCNGNVFPYIGPFRRVHF